ncbi:hypothetical protein E2C01_047196 [Portunus trituberculatus]|uniref:Uncharacterized protein n=1 Tax=Portunus trituberculatus TaxID=210409 RepID=A0A5B7G6X2_PORTR|nr:hypothetical protein [Portunus trituberculatus]
MLQYWLKIERFSCSHNHEEKLLTWKQMTFQYKFLFVIAKPVIQPGTLVHNYHPTSQTSHHTPHNTRPG